MENQASQDSSMIELLTDDELRERLIERGIQAGPIVASTRKFYENKLKKVLGNHTEEKEEIYEAGDDVDNVENSFDFVNQNNISALDNTSNIMNDKLYPDISQKNQHFLLAENENSSKSKWSPDEMRRRPIRDYDNFEYKSPYLNKSFEVKPQSDEPYLSAKYKNYDIKTKPLSSTSSYGTPSGHHHQRKPWASAAQATHLEPGHGADSSSKRYLYYLIIAIVFVGLLLSLPRLVNWQDDDNAIPIMD